MKTRKMQTVVACLTILLSLACFTGAWAKPTQDKIKDWIEDTSDTLKKGVDKFGDNLQAIQKYLDNYHWKGILQEQATYDAATLRHLRLNGHPLAIVVRPGERIRGIVDCHIDRDKCSALSLYRIVVGFAGKGPQTTIGNELGMAAGESLEQFDLIAPTEPGVYQIRFKLVEALFEQTAFEKWLDENGQEPSGTTTIGIVIVKGRP